MVTRTLKNQDFHDLARELKKRVSGDVRFDRFSRALYSTDASIYQMEPIGVILPKTAEDVSLVIEMAAERRIPVLPRGAATSLAGQTVNNAIVLDFSRYMDQLLEVNHEEHWALVEPGIVLDDLNSKLSQWGLQYAPDPTTSNRATVGGGIGNNSCGSHSVVYGKTIDHILELQTILSDGTESKFGPVDAATFARNSLGSDVASNIYRQVSRIATENKEEVLARFPKIMRRVSGYNLDEFVDVSPHDRFNLSKMIVGSEGTLCVVTKAKINLVPVPKLKALVVINFRHVIEACEATWEILQHDPAAVELIGSMIIDKYRSNMGFTHLQEIIDGQPDALLVVEVNANTTQELESKLDGLEKGISKKKLGYSSKRIMDKTRQSSVWEFRKAGLGLLMSTKGDLKPLPFVEDTAVHPRSLGEYMRRFDEIIKFHGTTAGYYGHASVGCLHVRPIVNLTETEGVEKMVSITSAISDLVMEFGGALSGEHGDGIVRGAWNEKMFGTKIYNAFREIKNTFDPKGIMNPGKILDCPPMTEHLRYRNKKNPSPVIHTKFDFSEFQGYQGAAEMCNGMGACRKMNGVMCPSFMATREEEHSTRGRANLLRAVLSGSIPGETLSSQRLHKAMDLCLECKGCKAECDAGVDMAKLKSEFLYKYNQKHGISLRTRLFTNIDTLNRIGSRFSSFLNIACNNFLVKSMLHIFLGIHSARTLPYLAKQGLPEWFNSRQEPSVSFPNGKVVLFNDTFISYNYPEVGKSAVRVLERAGYEVILASIGEKGVQGISCCGRPFISKGLLDKAVSNARRNVDLLYEYVRQGFPIIGCEPSCVLALKDEYVGLINDQKAKEVAQSTYLIDEFLISLHKRGQLDLGSSGVVKKVLFFGHCHQKAHGGTKYSTDLLELLPGVQVKELVAGCCGMAGAFGYEKEHYDISMSIGRQKVFPAIESMDADWEIATMGISCRQQIEHGTGRKVRHLMEIFEEGLY